MRKFEVTLCDPSKQFTCPKFVSDGSEVVVTDDHGGKVRMTEDEFALMKTMVLDGRL